MKFYLYQDSSSTWQSTWAPPAKAYIQSVSLMNQNSLFVHHRPVVLGYCWNIVLFIPISSELSLCSPISFLKVILFTHHTQSLSHCPFSAVCVFSQHLPSMWKQAPNTNAILLYLRSVNEAENANNNTFTFIGSIFHWTKEPRLC